MIPDGWKQTTFGSLARVINGYAFKSSDFQDEPNDAVAVIRMSNLKAGRLDLSDARYVPSRIVKELDRFELKAGDFLFGMSGSLSNYGRVAAHNGRCYLNQRVGKLEAVKGDRKFAAYLFLSQQVMREIELMAAGAAQLNISGKQIESINVITPPHPEQKKIAAILTTVDEAIEKQEAQIAKLQSLKKAMMQELLTQGIGHTEFKDSPIGRIPKRWEVKRLSDCLSIKPQYGAGSSANVFSYGLVRYIRITDILEDGTLSPEGKVGIPEQEAQGYYLSQGDVLIARTGNTVGKSYLHKNRSGVAAFAGYLIRFVTAPNILKPQFLFAYTQSRMFKDWVVNMSRVGAQPNINAQEYGGLDVPLPSISEQQKIVSTLTSIDNNIEAKQKKLAHTESLKKALMQDLLTGKVRVKV